MIASLNLHRRPFFIGTVTEVIEDCCGHCPIPTPDSEEMEIAAEEQKIYISGRISFLKDDPGRQEIGSKWRLQAQNFTSGFIHELRHNLKRSKVLFL